MAFQQTIRLKEWKSIKVFVRLTLYYLHIPKADL